MTTPTMQYLPRGLPAPTSEAAVKARYLAVLSSQVGYREGRDPDGDWNNDNAFGLYMGQNRVSWCHWFASWGAVAASISDFVIPRTGYTPSGWNWFRARGRDVSSPQAGDLFYVYGWVASEGVSRVHHVGVVEKVLAGGYIQTLEGNTNTSGSDQGNGVYRLKRRMTASLRYARPDYAKAVSVPVPSKPSVPTTPVTPAVPEEDPMAGITLADIKAQSKAGSKEALTEYMAGLYNAAANGTAGRNHLELKGLLLELLKQVGLTDDDVDAISAKVDALVEAKAAEAPKA